tara:strand:- start:2906 stop:4003 length:1098 start_codon:yes stop_codon:yes gene_type:complete
MLFMNKKEEVLDIQLTPHGRYLLSLGKLKPVYYSFHDSNILYDGRYAGLSQLTKEIEDRIQHNTPQSKTATSIVSRDQNVKSIFETSLSLAAGVHKATQLASVEQNNDEKIFLLSPPIGSCSPTTNKAPVWSVKVLNGEINKSVPNLTSSYQTLNIPQVDINVSYKTAVMSLDETDSTLAMSPDPALSSKVFDDGTYIAIDPDHLLLEVLEENTVYHKTNFEVEVFEMLKEVRGAAKGGLAGSITTQETMKPLFFKRPVNPIQNNILLDESELETPEPIGENSSMINYYFNVFVDKEIDKTDICAAVDSLDSKSLFVDLDIDCVPNTTPTRYDVYTGPEAIEACPPPDTADTTDTTGTAGADCDD